MFTTSDKRKLTNLINGHKGAAIEIGNLHLQFMPATLSNRRATLYVFRINEPPTDRELVAIRQQLERSGDNIYRTQPTSYTTAAGTEQGFLFEWTPTLQQAAFPMPQPATNPYKRRR